MPLPCRTSSDQGFSLCQASSLGPYGHQPDEVRVNILPTSRPLCTWTTWRDSGQFREVRPSQLPKHPPLLPLLLLGHFWPSDLTAAHTEAPQRNGYPHLAKRLAPGTRRSGVAGY